MSDISKCPGLDCPLKEKCYRYTSPSNPKWQSWMGVPDKTGKECPYFWPVQEEKEIA